jgi:hypothetical protein
MTCSKSTKKTKSTFASCKNVWTFITKILWSVSQKDFLVVIKSTSLTVWASRTTGKRGTKTSFSILTSTFPVNLVSIYILSPLLPLITTPSSLGSIIINTCKDSSFVNSTIY